jgi:hypothetical protein
MIQTAVCDSFELEVADGMHALTDEYRLALIKPNAAGSYGAGTTNYAQLGADEAEGAGWPHGGVPIKRLPTTDDPSGRLLNFEGIERQSVAIKAAGALIYNASKEGRAVSVHKLPQAIGTAGGELVVRINQPVRLLRQA